MMTTTMFMLPLLSLIGAVRAEGDSSAQAATAATSITTLPCSQAVDAGLPAYTFGPQVLECFGGVCGAPNLPDSPDFNPDIAPLATNATDIPYCLVGCLVDRAGGESSSSSSSSSGEVRSRGPMCLNFCSGRPAADGTIENYAWCLYWCALGKEDDIAALSCVPSIPYHAETITQNGTLASVNVLGPSTLDVFGNPESSLSTSVGVSAEVATRTSITAAAATFSASLSASRGDSVTPAITSTSRGQASAAAEAASNSSSAAAAPSTSHSGAQRVESSLDSPVALILFMIVGLACM